MLNQLDSPTLAATEAGKLGYQQLRVLILSASVGAGHDSAAYELQRRLETNGHESQVVNSLDAAPLFFRWMASQYGNSVNNTPWMFAFGCWIMEFEWFFISFFLLLCFWPAERTVLDWTKDYDIVVSTYMASSQVLGNLRERHLLDIPVITYVTDPALNRLWAHREVDIHVCPYLSDRTTASLKYGIDIQPVAPLVAGKFGTHDAMSRPKIRRELSIKTEERVAVISTGSLGLGGLDDTLQALLSPAASPSSIDKIIVLCGRNQRLQDRLSRLANRRIVILGWRSDIEAIYAASDVLIHNAGGLSCAEAFVAGLPVITYQPIVGHGLANAACLERDGLAAWPKDEESLGKEVRKALAGGRELGVEGKIGSKDLATIVEELASAHKVLTKGLRS